MRRWVKVERHDLFVLRDFRAELAAGGRAAGLDRLPATPEGAVADRAALGVAVHVAAANLRLRALLGGSEGRQIRGQLVRDRDLPEGRGRFQLVRHDRAELIGPAAAAPHVDEGRLLVEVHAVPAQAADLAAAHAGIEAEHDAGLDLQALHGVEQLRCLLLRQRVFLRRRPALGLELARGILRDGAGVLGRVEDLLQDPDCVLLRAAAFVRARGQDILEVVPRDLPQQLCADHGADHLVDLKLIDPALLLAQVRSAPGIERGGILEKVQLILRRGVGRCELVLFERDLFGELRQRLAVDVDPAAAGLRQPLAIIPALRAVLRLGFSRHFTCLDILQGRRSKLRPWTRPLKRCQGWTD